MKQLRKSNTTIQPNAENTFTPQSPESSPKFGTTKHSEQHQIAMRDNRRLTLKQVLDRRPSRSSSAHKDELRSRSFVNAEK